MAKIYHVIQIKLNRFKKMWSLTYQQRVFKRYHSDKHLSVFTYKMTAKINLHRCGRNYVTVTLYVWATSISCAICD